MSKENKESIEDKKTESSQEMKEESTKELFDPTRLFIIFTGMMLSLPISTYFGVNRMTRGNVIMSVLGTVLVVNLILTAFVVLAWYSEFHEGIVDNKEKTE